MMERYILWFDAHNKCVKEKSLTDHYFLIEYHANYHVNFSQVDVWALGVSAIEMAEVCFIY